VATTALFVEILLAGLQALAWIAVLVGLLAGEPVTLTGIKTAAMGLKDWAAPLTLLGLAAAYPLGIVVDRIADSFDRHLHDVLRAAGLSERRTPAPVNVMRLLVMKESEGIGTFVDYQRSRMRVARVTVLNLVLAAPIALAQAASVPGGDAYLPLVGVIAVVLIGMSVSAAERIRQAYEERLADAYAMLATQPVEDAVAAAVCYRRDEHGLRLLLVRTTGARYWTFPKGHIEREERSTPWKTAEREAREEAGIVGTALKAPLALYRFPARVLDAAARADYRVAAFLVETVRELTVHEAGREPTWCTPAEALARIAEGGREEIYVKEQQAVVEAAAVVLGGTG
jgi:8-oxo-dGTP pyrophosphatase MutT (NUDIX family)